MSKHPRDDLVQFAGEVASCRQRISRLRAEMERLVFQIKASAPDSMKWQVLKNKFLQTELSTKRANKKLKALQAKLDQHVSRVNGSAADRSFRHTRKLHTERETSGEIRNQLKMLRELQKNDLELTTRDKQEVEEDIYDLFISHASEDKEDFVRPLANELIANGLRVWYDEMTLMIGDSLRRSIDAGLAKSTYGLVVLSSDFFAKNWTQYELNGLVSREMEGKKVILPIWHKVTKDEVLRFSPSLVDKVALNTAFFGVGEIAKKVATAVRKRV